ncbi:ADP-ribosylglycohydrolase family protein [Lentzea sp. DG1S-22]|uniref:ADP-ribosylglycohydrolase family protein n=1 Tax=Lentzea sp. DG1S-22 TaxID=3108822 RepID=UPI002E769EF5|nr:ADP-ribosylglycohydrolase family protein [Lentzea sp. DG1S-22]WVH84585.1 ADP-ribosylglycohydrolase family protein [Lentzea sp. DG1S-22]
MRIVLHTRARLDLAYASLDGLSVGDALGAQFFMVGRSVPDLVAGKPPRGPWEWTDDTEMACNLVAELRDHGEVDQDSLAAAFADRCEPYRGYGAGAFTILHKIRRGTPWKQAAGSAFHGQGSCGNGAAMRIAPLGAYFADDPKAVTTQAVRAGEVTHQHPEGIAGGVAVAHASAIATRARLTGAPPHDLLGGVLEHLAESLVRKGIEKARKIDDAEEAAHVLGNGSRVTAQDTVPFALWVASRHLGDYRAAITTCVQAGGDIDTTAAIVGGVVTGPPQEWLQAREPLPGWVSRTEQEL